MFEVKQVKNSNGDDVIVAQLTDLEKYLVTKVETLHENGKLEFDTRFGKKLWLCTLGDKGGSEFKLCLALGNVKVPNSAYHLVPLGMFTDDESVTAVTTHLSHTIEQLNNLKGLVVTLDGVQEYLPAVHFLGGDMKFQYQMIGHSGASSKKSCMFCLTEKRTIGEYVRNTQCHQRIDADYSSDSKNGTNSIYRGSKFVFEQTGVQYITPPSLHICMGLAQRYGFSVLLDMATDLDIRANIRIDESKSKALRSAKKMFSTNQEQCNDLEKHLDSLGILLDVMRRFQAHSIVLSKVQVAETSHGVCAGKWSPEDTEVALDLEPDWTCLKCSGRRGAVIIDDAAKVIEEVKDRLDELKNKLKESENSYETLKHAIDGKGSKRMELHSVWARLGVDMNAHKKDFCGNHVMKLLEEAAIEQEDCKKMCAAITDDVGDKRVGCGTAPQASKIFSDWRISRAWPSDFRPAVYSTWTMGPT
uniref:Uncharacterized protein n=1 Tax=Caenorhabditis japonica TaxID=281687 RepID=A0A8R1HJU4_CAEJA